MLKFLVGGGGGDKESLLVASRKAANYPGAGDGSMTNGNDVLEFGFENTVASLVLQLVYNPRAKAAASSIGAHL